MRMRVASENLSRVLGVALVALITLGWPVASSANVRWNPTLVRQDPVATIHSATAPATVAVTLQTGGSNGDNTAVDVALYPRVTTRSGLDGVLAGTGVSSSAITHSGAFALDCRTNGVATFRLSVGEGSGTARSTCGGAQPYLELACTGVACDGVYPISYTITRGADASTIWSLLAVSGSVTNPVISSWVFTSNPVDDASARRESAALDAIAQWPSTYLSVAPSYVNLSDLAYSTRAPWQQLRSAMTAALSSRRHAMVNHPSASVDLQTPATHGLLVDVRLQAGLAASVVSTFARKPVSFITVLGGTVTPGDVTALSAVGIHDIVVPDEALTYPTSNTLDWGTPFHIYGAAGGAIAAASDTPLRHLAEGSASSGGLRATLALGTLALLHFEAPYAIAGRTVVIDAALSTTTSSFISALMSESRRDPLVHIGPVDWALRPNKIGAGGYPTVRSLAVTTPSRWSSNNVASTKTLNVHLGGLASSTVSVRPELPATSLMLLSQRRIHPSERQREINMSASLINEQLAKFAVDDTTITLTGGGTPLPITVTSKASYTMSGWLSLHANGVTFPNGDVVAFSISTPSESIHVPAVIHGAGSFTLNVKFLTKDRRVIVATSAIEVHSGAASVVGYVLSIGSVLVIAVWWWRTTRRTSAAKHSS